MFSFLTGSSSHSSASFDRPQFSHLRLDALYFDSTCQTLRPQCVIDAEVDYYHNFNACGHRVKYP